MTRGPDTGAFHHPLFQRDASHLCLQMVCQRSRDRRSSGSANKQQQGRSKLNLPPKSQPLAPAGVSAVSLDGQSSSASLTSRSSSSLTSSSHTSEHRVVSGFLRVPSTASTAPASGPATVAVNMAVANLVAAQSNNSTGTTPSLVHGYVSKNEALIQDALKLSQEQERLRAAKAMLYHAYMQALGQATAGGTTFPAQHQSS